MPYLLRHIARGLFCLTVLALLIPAGAPIAQEAAEDFDPDSYFSTMRWRNIGPTRGGRSVAVAGVVQDPQTYYFGSTGGGLWKTRDAGTSWTNVSDGFFKTGSVGAIAVAESDPNVIFVGMGEHAVRGVMTTHGDGVYKSTDAGETWTHMGLAETRVISRIRVHPTNPDLVYVAAQGATHGWTEDRGIYRSSDGGTTWEKIHYVSDRAGAADISMDMTNPRILYAAYWEHIRRPWIVESGGPGSGIWKSKDGGDTWTELSAGLPETMGKISVDVSRANPDRVYAIVEAEYGTGGLYRSDDAGASWSHLSDDRNIQTRSWYYMEVYADPQDENTVVVLNAPFMRSIDGGRTFQFVGVPHGDNHDLWVNPNDNQIMINANDGGANVSFNAGASWSTQQNQPTAQFYRVIADEQFPYHVYGGQQDNSAIGIASAASGVIGWKDFYDVSGCESAYLAFDNPREPRFVYGTCIQGDIDVWDRESGERKPIRPYPQLGLGVNPIDQKFRFNWNNPVVGSPNADGVIYQAGNVLFRTDDRGQSWQPISPDLTRNDEEKQQIGGGPFTNENAGGEVYNTIMYVAESSAQAGVLWVGTDDGLVQLSRDNGATWSDVTPEAVQQIGRGGDSPGEALINAVEASPHDPGTAYVAVTRYKFNDLTPHFFRTTDFGESWTRIVDGIDGEHWARVIREDPERAGLLYAGTENGLYISFDAGDQWHAWQRNLPIVPITDLMVHPTGDLIAATQGRAFWILDDLSPVRALADSMDSSATLVAPRETVMVTWSGGFGPGPGPGAGSFPGQNPPAGAQLYFHLPEPTIDAADAADETAETPVVTLRILAADGATVRTMSTDQDLDGADTLQTQPGLNRVAWDFRHTGIESVENIMVFGSFGGRQVTPGNYTVELTVGDEVQTQPLTLAAAPWRAAGASDYMAQDEFMVDVHDLLASVTGSVNRWDAVRVQLGALASRAEDVEGSEDLVSTATELADRIEAWDAEIVARRTQNFQDIINFENKLLSQVIALAGAVDGTAPPVTAGSRERLADLRAEWDALAADVTDFEAGVGAVNDLVNGLGMGGIVLPREE
ncbi:MAG: glycosyl hydrolase [Acidobacteria bacterium]|nr:glycosyl hydrolase [Acidobacteriota bacterium]